MKNDPALYRITRSADVRRDSQKRSTFAERKVFTVEEHLTVQRQIERRALDLWHERGCRRGTALSDWLQAEREILEQFIRAYVQRHGLRQAASPRASVCVARKNPEPRILKPARSMAARPAAVMG